MPKTSESILIEKHSAMGTTESQLYECFCHFTTNWRLGLHRLWIDDSNGKVIYRSKWFEESELEEYSKAAIAVAKLCNHNWMNEFQGRIKDVGNTKCSCPPCDDGPRRTHRNRRKGVPPLRN